MIYRFVISLFFLIGCASEDPGTSETLVVENPWARAAPEGGRSAVYLNLVNEKPVADTLSAATTDAAARVELHETVELEDNMRGMRQVEMIPIAAGGTATLEPGGLHIMLIDLAQMLAPDDTITLDLTFAHDGTQRVRVPVRGLDAPQSPSP